MLRFSSVRMGFSQGAIQCQEWFPGSTTPANSGLGADRKAVRFRVKLRWESAQPLIDSGKRKRSKQAEVYYIVSASGLPVLEPYEEPKEAALEEQVAVESANRRKPITVRLKENTMLERKGKDLIYPEIEGSGMRVSDIPVSARRASHHAGG